MAQEKSTTSATSAELTERAQGKAERVVLGKWPLGTMVRLVLIPLAFILIAGTAFYLLNR